MRYNPTERIGVNAVERIVLEDLKWIFREQPIVDVGIDALIEIVDEGNPTGQFIAAQIKSGKGNFHQTENSFTYYTSDIHYNYWTKSNLPIILVAYIPDDSSAYWVPILLEKFRRNKRQWRIDIPMKQKLNAHSENRLRSLLDHSNVIITNEIWTNEKTEELTVKAENISKSADLITEITNYLSSLRLSFETANVALNELITQGENIKSYQTEKVLNTISASIRTLTPEMEETIQEFSEVFAEGFEAFKELVNGCIEFNLNDVLQEILTQIIQYPETAEIAINQIKKLKETTDNFSKDNKKLKASTIILAEVLGLIGREIKVAKELTEKIIEAIQSGKLHT